MKNELAAEALKMGAKDVKAFEISQIAFDARTLLKCFFGCPGGMPYCPSPQDMTNTLTYQDLIKKYRWGIMICTDNLKKGQEITLALESKAFLAGYYFALGATECANCSSCNFEKGNECIDKYKPRPPLYSLGIDVYQTVRNLGWELEVVQKKGDPVKNITAVFVE